MSEEKILIFDGNLIIYKAYYATQRGKDEETIMMEFYETLGAIKRIVKKVLFHLDVSPNGKNSIVALDTSRKTFRSEQFKDYKMNRPAMPFPLRKNLELINKTFFSLGLELVFAPESYEADDVMASIAHKLSEKGMEIFVISADRDLLQLVNNKISVVLISSGSYQVHNVHNFPQLNHGLLPFQIPLYKALAGDRSDNYKGLPGIGNITAIRWLLKYRDIDNIYRNLDDFSEKHKRILLEHKEELHRCLSLSHVCKNLDLPDNLKDAWN